jgi:hypothetical protein
MFHSEMWAVRLSARNASVAARHVNSGGHSASGIVARWPDTPENTGRRPSQHSAKRVGSIERSFGWLSMDRVRYSRTTPGA